jgi:hypothetical protein
MSSIFFNLPKARPWLPRRERTKSIYDDISEGRIRAEWRPRDGTWGPRRTLAIDEQEISRILQEEGERLNAALADHRARYAQFQKAVAAAQQESAKSGA